MAKLNHYIGMFPDHEAAFAALERHGSKEVGLLYRNMDGTIYMCDGEGWLPLATGETASGGGGLDGFITSIASRMGDIIAARVSDAVSDKLSSIVIQAPPIAPAPGDPDLPYLDESVADVVSKDADKIEAASESRDLAETEKVEDGDLVDEMASLKALKATKEDEEDA
jgi:hypothetical protein